MQITAQRCIVHTPDRDDEGVFIEATVAQEVEQAGVWIPDSSSLHVEVSFGKILNPIAVSLLCDVCV